MISVANISKGSLIIFDRINLNKALSKNAIDWLINPTPYFHEEKKILGKENEQISLGILA